MNHCNVAAHNNAGTLRAPGRSDNGLLIQLKPTRRPPLRMEASLTHTFREKIMGRLLSAAALFIATTSITVTMAATGAPSAQPEAGTVTQYQDPN